MGPAQDCILGVLSGQGYLLSYPGLEAYVDSIVKSGFRGRKIMLCRDISPIAQTLLVQGGFELVPIQDQNDFSFFHMRIRVAAEYMEDHWEEFRYVFWLDIKDLVVQTDPSKWMENNLGDNKLVAACECVTIEQEETNRVWALDVLGEHSYHQIKNCEVINGGTWAGDSEYVKKVLDHVWVTISEYVGPYPPCQPAINFAMHIAFHRVLYIPRWEEGFAACLHPFWSPSARSHCNPYLRDKAPVLDAETKLMHPGQLGNPKNDMLAFDKKALTHIPAVWGPITGVELVKRAKHAPFSIVHGYDRDWHIRCWMEEIYDAKNVIKKWAEIKNLACIELKPVLNDGVFSTLHFDGIDAYGGVDETWPIADNSVAMIQAVDALPAIASGHHAMSEIYRVLAPGGWFFCQVPSTDGRGAFENPAHVSRWNIDSFRHYLKPGVDHFFHEGRLYDTGFNSNQVVWTHAHLLVNK